MDALDFDCTSQEYVTKTFDERIQDLEEYRRTHGHVNVKIHEDYSLRYFCANIRQAGKKAEKMTKDRLMHSDLSGGKTIHHLDHNFN